MTTAPDRLRAALRTSPLCVGIDPHPGELAAWGLPDSADGARTFALRLLDAAVAGGARVVKPQVALFERHGSRGFAILEEVLAAARGQDVFAVADAKRGDIGSTMAGYADAWIRRGSPLRADAVTVSPYLGFDSLRPALDLLVDEDAIVFALALTSNPSGPQVQHARGADGEPVGGAMLRLAAREDEGRPARVGVVIGATVGRAAQSLGLDPGTFPGPVLTPGYGAQGATGEDLRELFGPVAADHRLAVNASRGISGAGSDSADLTRRIVQISADLRGALGVD